MNNLIIIDLIYSLLPFICYLNIQIFYLTLTNQDINQILRQQRTQQ